MRRALTLLTALLLTAPSAVFFPVAAQGQNSTAISEQGQLLANAREDFRAAIREYVGQIASPCQPLLPEAFEGLERLPVEHEVEAIIAPFRGTPLVIDANLAAYGEWRDVQERWRTRRCKRPKLNDDQAREFLWSRQALTQNIEAKANGALLAMEREPIDMASMAERKSGQLYTLAEARSGAQLRADTGVVVDALFNPCSWYPANGPARQRFDAMQTVHKGAAREVDFAIARADYDYQMSLVDIACPEFTEEQQAEFDRGNASVANSVMDRMDQLLAETAERGE